MRMLRSRLRFFVDDVAEDEEEPPSAAFVTTPGPTPTMSMAVWPQEVSTEAFSRHRLGYAGWESIGCRSEEYGEGAVPEAQ